MSEIELLNRIKSNPAEFSELFKLYYKPIFGYILRRTGNFDEAADITADTFFKAFRHIKTFSYKGISIKVWLYRIATNELNIYLRQRKKYNSIFDKLDIKDKDLFADYISDDKKEYELELQKHDQFLSVLKGLKTLPVKYHKEIAEILVIKEGTLKSLLSRGLEKLREKCNQI